jgi:hypothetical protein
VSLGLFWSMAKTTSSPWLQPKVSSSLPLPEVLRPSMQVAVQSQLLPATA